ncbi:hypothetical protein SARC_09389 [Sphaeroforma arctica JP610]|uniref:Aldehyde dehydrogenase domain-containing protein n=1 Tax=Sphaeroforma arctica JP610 TaxID=667725 RepID=A0A0L0FNY3_9EUKA|nr:hypothetical protein SARC_09389 [Sphaeroforma arctica JP610]KNC78171.1 hypothetical protein SARC_09389 [Sphaeroforma arctica JP610]|eukprot:XP_014152073.1 hypothetical protein SARC_09389 [Sphaeroforma arctica JP610]
MSLMNLQHVASKQSDWRALAVDKKIELMSHMLQRMCALQFEDYIEMFGAKEASMMGISRETSEGELVATSNTFLQIVIVKSTLERLLEAYQLQIGTLPKPELQQTTSLNGQTVLQTIPVLSADKYGMLGSSRGEVWLKQTISDVKTFDLKNLEDDATKTGAMVVLGAGNFCFLSVVDALHGLFQSNRVVYMKHHPVRAHHDELVRYLFAPLIVLGYFDTELDQGVPRAQELVNAECVSYVHLTGGKATHDAIVWGGPQREKPVLKAEMTSELGCITPWLVADQEYTAEELAHQAKHIFYAMYGNAGAACNSPKVLILPRHWKQKEAFIQTITSECQRDLLPVAYYPGMKKRWDGFRAAYKEAKEIISDNKTERKLTAPMLSNEPQVVPWLVVEIDVNFSTEEGRKQASNEYAFQNEPFAPVFTIAYVEDLATGVDLCNNYIYGSLSCSMTAREDVAEVETAIANLKYGSIVVNAWSAFGFFATGLTWGAFPGESLESVESGRGQVSNLFFIDGVEKSVLRTPVLDRGLQAERDEDLSFTAKKDKAVAKFVLHPGVFTFLNMLSATKLGRELPTLKGLFAYMKLA